jgi:lipopolysaccharide export system protein LptC
MHRQHHIEAFILLLVVALLAALGFALWQQQHSQDSGAAERPSCRPVQYAQENAGRPALEPVAMAPLGSGHPGGALPSSERTV